MKHNTTDYINTLSPILERIIVIFSDDDVLDPDFDDNDNIQLVVNNGESNLKEYA